MNKQRSIVAAVRMFIKKSQTVKLNEGGEFFYTVKNVFGAPGLL